MVTEADLTLPDGRSLHVYDTGAGADTALTVLWHHGTPNLGWPPEPLFAASAERGIRWVSIDRPSYGSSSPQSGRTIASVASDVEFVMDSLGVNRFATMGASGGGPHALACAALLPGRVLAVACAAGIAPLDSPGLDWFAGMGPSGTAELRASVQGRAALEALMPESEFDESMFNARDYAALSGDWAWLGRCAGAAIQGGFAGLIDDDLAYVAPWGFELSAVAAPVLFLQGDDDRVVPAEHARWQAARCSSSELRVVPGAGHVSVLEQGVTALDWLLERA